MSAIANESTQAPSGFDALQASGLASDAAAVARLASRPPPLPWVLHLVIGFAALVASALILVSAVFVNMKWLLRDSNAQLVTGLILCGAAAAVNRLLAKEDDRSASATFRAQMLLAVGLVGFGLVYMGLVSVLRDNFEHQTPWRTAATALFAAMLVVLNPERIHRFVMAVLFAVFGWIAITRAGILPGGQQILLASVTALWLTQPWWGARRTSDLLLTVAQALTVAYLLLALMPMVLPRGAYMLFLSFGAGLSSKPGELAMFWAFWGYKIVATLLIVASVVVLRRRAQADPSQPTAAGPAVDRSPPGTMPAWLLVILALAAAWCVYRMPVVSAMLLLWVLTLVSGQRTLAHLILACLLIHGTLDYYNQMVPLMTKGLKLLELAAVAAGVTAAMTVARRQVTVRSAS